MVLVDYIGIFFLHFPILLTDNCILFCPHFIVCHKRSFDLFIQDDKKILFILEFRSIMQSSFVFNLLEQENERNPDRSCSSACCTCTYCREMPEGKKVCCKENSERCHSRMPVNIICFIPLLLFCCMILFLTVLWLHQY